MTDDVRTSGPLFDGRAEAALHRGIEAARQSVADLGAQMTRSAFAASIRDNHGHFLASITTTGKSRTFESRGDRKTYTLPVVVDSSDETVVTTDLATYGPWLEGSGSRNHTTRFHGYHGFRKAAQALDHVAAERAKVAIVPYVREMND